jgi:hypothetical protein
MALFSVILEQLFPTHNADAANPQLAAADAVRICFICSTMCPCKYPLILTFSHNSRPSSLTPRKTRSVHLPWMSVRPDSEPPQLLLGPPRPSTTVRCVRPTRWPCSRLLACYTRRSRIVCCCRGGRTADPLQAAAVPHDFVAQTEPPAAAAAATAAEAAAAVKDQADPGAAAAAAAEADAAAEAHIQANQGEVCMP